MSGDNNPSGVPIDIPETGGAEDGALARSDEAKQPDVSKSIPRARLKNTDIHLALFEVLQDYNRYEHEKLEAEVAAGAPRPIGYSFTLPGLYKYLADVTDDASTEVTT